MGIEPRVSTSICSSSSKRDFHPANELNEMLRNLFT